MEFEGYIRLLLAAGALCLGAFLTAVRARLTSTKEKNTLHYFFYLLSGIVLLAAVALCFVFHYQIFKYAPDIAHPEITKVNPIAATTIIFSIISSLGLVWFTRKYLVGKRQFKSQELDPIVNSFTQNADKNKIKLLAGDLNFFGESPLEMEVHSQYTCLKKERFRSIEILCTKPESNIEKIRYGKIMSDLPVKIKFYRPTQADLNIRGRMKTLNNVTHLLIYNKIKTKVYDALELDTADKHGALYDHIWNLIWDLAEEPSREDIEDYKKRLKIYLG